MMSAFRGEGHSVRAIIPKPVKTSRNPLLYARELRDRMLTEGINRAELARRLGVSSVTGQFKTRYFSVDG